MTEEAPKFTNQDNALIWAELKHVQKQNALMAQTLGTINGRVKDAELHAAVCQDRWKTHFKEHENVKRNGWLGDIISSIIAVIVTILAAFGYNAVK